jgi:hypothetical protein
MCGRLPTSFVSSWVRPAIVVSSQIHLMICLPLLQHLPSLALCERNCIIEDPCNRLAAGKRAVHSSSGPRPFWPHLTCGSRKTYIERLNSAVPHDVSSQSGRGPADDDVIVNGYTLCPQRSALRGAVVSVVLERNGRGMAIVGRVGAHAAGMPLMVLPVGRDYAIALWTSSAAGVRLKARRLHPSTVACGWRVREWQRQSKGRVLSDSARRDVRGRGSGWWEGSLWSVVCSVQPDTPP